jgi:integrase
VRLRGEILNAIERGTFNYRDHFPQSKNAARFGMAQSGKTIGDLLDDYEKTAARALSASTWKGYKKIIDRCLRPWWGKTRVVELTPAEIRTRLLAEDVTLKTARNMLTPLSVVLAAAVNDGELDANPLDRVLLGPLWPKERRRSGWKPDPFSFEEMTAIFAACRDDEEADYWRFAFGTGLRPSEQIALAWAQCDLSLGRVRIEQAQVMGIDGAEMKEPKTLAGLRTVLLTAGAKEALQRQLARGMWDGGRVFRDARYAQPWRDEQALRKRFARIIARAKLPGGEPVRYRNPYQTRHTFASVLLAAGYPPLWVAKQMGHANTDMLVRHYGRWIEQGQNEAARAALDTFFSHQSPETAKIIAFR